MPDARKFLGNGDGGFNLVPGRYVGGYKLVSADSSHESIRRYQEYKYDIVLNFVNMGRGAYDDLYSGLYKIISEEHIIYGVRNPYRCIIDPIMPGSIILENDNSITFYLVGHSYRL
jgi:hypothetical protein